MELLRDDLHYILTRLPKDLKKLLQQEALYGVYLGGGCIRDLVAGTKINDYDLFGSSKELLQRLAHDLVLKRNGRIYKTDNALTILAPPRTPVQFITRWLYSDPTQLIHSLDFSVCQAVIWWTQEEGQPGYWHSLISPNFYPDLAARRLRYTHPQRNEAAGGSMLRVVKYLARGYRISPESLAGVIARLSVGINWDQVLHTAQEGKESPELQATKVITGLLREVDPLSVVDGLDFVEEETL